MKECISWIVSIVNKIAGIFNSDKNKNIREITIKKFKHNNHTTIINGDYLSKDQLADRDLKDKKNETEI